MYTADIGHLFIQDKDSTEVQSPEEGMDLIVLLSDNEEQVKHLLRSKVKDTEIFFRLYIIS